jgi:hypothetical protein
MRTGFSVDIAGIVLLDALKAGGLLRVEWREAYPVSK